MTQVLLVGYDPETVDFSNPALPPGMTAEKIRAARHHMTAGQRAIVIAKMYPGADIALFDVANCFPSFIIGLMKPRGLYRERNGWGNQDSARVKYDEHQELDVSEDTYRARDYQPPFDELPWKDEPANDA